MAQNLLSQEEAEQQMRQIHDEIYSLPDRANCLMQPVYVSCDVKTMTFTTEYRVLPWELNRTGRLHGGIMGLMLDHTIGLTVAVLTGHWCPTVSLNINYLRPADADTELVCCGRIVKTGVTLFFLEGEIKSKETGKLIATATSQYLNTN